MGIIGDLFPFEILGQTSDLLNPAAWVFEGFGGSGHTSSGEIIGPESALALSAYYAGIRAISEDIAKLPAMVFKKLKPRGREPLPDHPVTILFDISPNPEMTGFSYREVMVSHMAGWGNHFAEIVRDRANRPVQLWPIHPSRVKMRRDKSKKIVYDIMADTTILSEGKEFNEVRLQAEDVFHVHGLGSNGLFGFSAASLGAESLGLSVAVQRFGSTFFGNGASVGGVLEHPMKLDQDARDNLRESWNKMHRGAMSAHQIAILEEGLKYSPVGIPPEEAQFLKTRVFQISEVARWLRIPNHKLQHLENAIKANIEQQSIEYVTDSLQGHITRIEKEVKRKLFTDAEKKKLTLEHNINALLRGDQKTRSAFYRSQVNIGSLTPNEVRELENMNPLGPEGDQALIQLNMTTLERVIEGEALPSQQNQPEEEPEEDEKDEDQEDSDDDDTEDDENEKELDKNDTASSHFVTDYMAFEAKIQLNMPVITDISARFVRKEIRAIGKLMKKHHGSMAEFQDSVNSFYDNEQGYMVDAFTPVLNVLFDDPTKEDTFAFMDNIDGFLDVRKYMMGDIYDEQGDPSDHEDSFVVDVSNNFIEFCENRAKKEIAIKRLRRLD